MNRYMPARFCGSISVAIMATPFLFIVKMVSPLAAAVLYRLDLRWKVTHLGFPKNYVIVARKVG
jgi:hypothetical protein